MKVSVTQDGGIGGLRLKPIVVDSSALPSSEAAELKRLVEAARSNPSKTEVAPGRARDAIAYRIVIDDEHSQTELGQTDADMSAAFDRLVAWLQHHRL